MTDNEKIVQLYCLCAINNIMQIKAKNDINKVLGTFGVTMDDIPATFVSHIDR
jgi:hypothetical protein